ncbi:LEAF RUST 10 DISEASE-RESISTANCEUS RECEPTOR-LIKE PROTEIN KINASE-like 2.3 isoform X2 [Elaeis guineensis]|uniref:Rust resistance kinase Lr10 isoform X2 n=1 Tax=Elaeis guineensis var. tenera TaxID=51953 RepID=A0A6I9SCR1_ELAGV|nr:rust resistance kinase Lr10 isoform X2 [Elaeis guineensis]
MPSGIKYLYELLLGAYIARRFEQYLVLSRLLSNFLLLLFLLAHSLYLSAASFIAYPVWNSSGELSCDDSIVECGGKDMKDFYPFMRVDPLSGSCYPQITCSQNNVVMKIGSVEYRINHIDYENQTLEMAIADYCLPYDQFQINYFSDVESLFRYTEHNILVLLLYNCSSRLLGLDGVHQLSCSNDSTGQYYYTAMDLGFFGSECASVTYAIANQKSMDQPIKKGVDGLMALEFEVTWTPQDRRGFGACIQSGGLYRSHPFLHDMVFCHCLDSSTYLHICPDQRGGILSTGIFLFVCVLLFYFCCDRQLNIAIFHGKNGSRKDPKLEAFIEMFGHLAPMRYSYSDVEKMTSCFSHKIGQGGYGGVYEGKLDNGCPVAVKVLNSSKGNGKEFFSEVISIGCTYHVNIVSLLGFCLEGSTRVLIYEFMANGSLEKFIYTKKQAIPSLTWEKLLKIAIGIARGLEYLHHGCNIGILHFDIKPHNVLLDDDMHPKISDFGLAKLCRSAESIISMVGARGTIGYIAPEVFSKKFGGVSSKSDVYSYGMLVLEMVGGRRNLEVQVDNTSEIYFPHWIYMHLNLDGNSKIFRAVTEVEEEIVRRMILVGLWCIQTKPTDRPSMSKVLDMLEGRIIDLQIPPMPLLSSPSKSAEHSLTNRSHEIVSMVTC